MKAISINQPWAWCIVNGYKPVENRDWPTTFRGPVLIHAGLKFDDSGYDFIRITFPDIPLPAKEDIERGGIVGKANITDCVEEMDSPWFFGDYGFVMTEQEPCELKPCKGALGFFEPDYNSRYTVKEPKARKTKTAVPSLFDDLPRRAPQKLMHVVDAGMGATTGERNLVDLECCHCGYRTGMHNSDRTVTELKRGTPCPKCNTDNSNLPTGE